MNFYVGTHQVFVTGDTGYIGRTLIAALLDRGHIVHALVRPGSEARLPPRALPVLGNALDSSTFVSGIPPNATVVHLVGTPHPSPAKAAEFRRVDSPRSAPPLPRRNRPMRGTRSTPCFGGSPQRAPERNHLAS